MKFVPLMALADLPLHTPTAAPDPAGGTTEVAICLLRSEHGVIAFTDSCPHRGHPLSLGRCDGTRLRCALHGWEFALPGGQAVSPRAPFGLEQHEVRVRGGIVEVAVGVDAGAAAEGFEAGRQPAGGQR